MMYIIIDGYNLLKQLFAHERITEKEQQAFVALLGRYKKKKGHKITIVFDAGPCFNPEQEKQHGIDVWYSGRYRSADDLIIQYVKTLGSKEILVVTLDRELIQQVNAPTVQVVKPLEFYQKVKGAFESPCKPVTLHNQHIVKLSQENNKALDLLMHEAAQMIRTDKDSFLVERSIRGTGTQTVSKRKKQQEKKLKKL